MLTKLRRYPLVILYIVLLIVVAGVGAVSPAFRGAENITNVLEQMVPLAFIALGQTCALLVGGVDLSVGALASIITAFGALLVGPTSTMWSVLFWLISSLTASLLFGVINGTLIVKLRISPLIATLCTGIIGQGIALALIPRPTGYIPRSFISFLTYANGFLELPFLYLIITVTLLYLFFRYARLGRHIYAVGGNRRSARISGLNIDSITTKSYILTSLLAGIGGVFLTCRIGCGDPTVGNPLTLDSVVAVLLGGTTFSGGEGGIMGSVAGAFLLTILGNSMNALGIQSFYQYIFKGLIFAAAVMSYSWAKKRQ